MEPKINYNQTIKKVINKKGTLNHLWSTLQLFFS